VQGGADANHSRTQHQDIGFRFRHLGIRLKYLPAAQVAFSECKNQKQRSQTGPDIVRRSARRDFGSKSTADRVTSAQAADHDRGNLQSAHS